MLDSVSNVNSPREDTELGGKRASLFLLSVVLKCRLGLLLLSAHRGGCELRGRSSVWTAEGLFSTQLFVVAADMQLVLVRRFLKGRRCKGVVLRFILEDEDKKIP